MEWLTDWDFRVLYRIREHLQCGFLDAVMPVITRLGNLGMIWILMAIALIATRKYRGWGITTLAGLGGGALIGNLLLKNLIARARPCWIDAAVPLLIPVPHDYSFPSGHTLSAVIAAVLLSFADRRFAPVVLPVAALIAFSRLYLFVHFPSDVLAAALLGLGIALLARFVYRRIAERRSGSAKTGEPDDPA